MKIVFIGTCFPMRGGLAQFNAILARELSKRHEVAFLSFSRQYPDLLFPGKTQFVTEEDAARTVQFPADAVLDSINPFSWWRTAKRAAAEEPDLIIFKYWMPFFAPAFGTISRWIKRWTGARVLFVCDNIVPHERRPFDGLLTRYAVSPVDAFVTMSASVSEDLQKVKPTAQWELVPHPVYDLFGQRVDKHAALETLGLPDGDWILFFGYIRRYKGLDLLIESLPKVRTRRNVRLLVAGEFYDNEARYRDLVKEHGVEDAVVFRSDYIPEDQVATYFSAADVVTLPYHSATQSGIIQVAYHLDTPVICTDVGGLGEVVLDQKTGFVVPPEDPQAVADAILRFYEEDWGERMRRQVEIEKAKYSWDRLVEAIERLSRQPARPSSGKGRREHERYN